MKNGANHGNFGKRHTSEAKAKMRLKRLGFKHSAETKAKIGAASKGRPSWCKGKKNPRMVGNTYGKGHIPKHKGENSMPDGFREKSRQAQYVRWGKVLPNYSPEYKGSKKRRLYRIAENGGSHTASEWDALKDTYNRTCPSCLRSEPIISLTKDHIIPLMLGGTDDISNIQPLCKSCNSSKRFQIKKFRYLGRV